MGLEDQPVLKLRAGTAGLPASARKLSHTAATSLMNHRGPLLNICPTSSGQSPSLKTATTEMSPNGRKM